MKAKYTLPLADPQAALEIVGGKGASLAKLAASELPVPDGFHVTTAAYLEFVEANELQPAILSALEGIDLANPSSLESASEQINALFLRASIPPGVAGEIVETYSELPGSNPAVAVRSSATAEDLP
ncbi:MAG: PEP/pyruvate-binding domain-containing protein, partial [Anaerolineales bacterium]